MFLVLFCAGLRSVCPVLFVLCALGFAEKGARSGAVLGVWWRKEARGNRLFAVFRCCSEPVYLKTRRFSMQMPIIALFG